MSTDTINGHVSIVLSALCLSTAAAVDVAPVTGTFGALGVYLAATAARLLNDKADR